jgi:energy-coupling factor transporter ATP-binding protein EcfA2
MKLELKKFDMRNIRDGSTILLIGRRGTGKSTVLADIFRHFTSLPIGVVVSSTERANHYFEQFIPKMLIYDEFDSKILQRFMDRQQKVTDQATTEKKKYGKTDIDHRAFLVLDDCLYDKSWPNDKNIRACFMNGRHYGILFAITMQYPLGIPPHLRANVDYVFILRDNMIKNRERLYNQYAGMFDSFHVFCQILDQCTQNFECLVIDNKTQSNNLTDQVYWYKADPSCNFKVCSQALWDAQAHEDELKAMGVGNTVDEDEEEYKPRTIPKKSTPMVRVMKSN